MKDELVWFVWFGSLLFDQVWLVMFGLAQVCLYGFGLLSVGLV